MIAIPLMAAGLRGTLNVRDDPSRSGAAPVEVTGWARPAVEFIVLGGGWTGYAIAGHRAVGIALAALTALHYARSIRRIRWLLGQ